jgi:hypothetical protein
LERLRGERSGDLRLYAACIGQFADTVEVDMTIDTHTVQGAGEVAPAIIPKSDAEAAALEIKQGTIENIETQEAAPKSEDDPEEKKRHRTREYINRQNRTIGELRAQLEMERQQKAAPVPQTQQTVSPDEPTLEAHNYDIVAYQRAHTAWAIKQARSEWESQTKQQAEQTQEQTTWQSYEQRAAEFAADHPDFLEVVNSIKYPLLKTVQAAIAAHPQGAALAYHLGQNDDDAFQIASIQPHLAVAAVERLASRLAAPQGQTKPIPITSAPPPPPRVGGRSPTSVAPEKMTDDEWLARERAQRKKG